MGEVRREEAEGASPRRCLLATRLTDMAAAAVGVFSSSSSSSSRLEQQ